MAAKRTPKVSLGYDNSIDAKAVAEPAPVRTRPSMNNAAQIGADLPGAARASRKSRAKFRLSMLPMPKRLSTQSGKALPPENHLVLARLTRWTTEGATIRRMPIPIPVAYANASSGDIGDILGRVRKTQTKTPPIKRTSPQTANARTAWGRPLGRPGSILRPLTTR